MASTNERKKEADCESKHVDGKSMKRGKPQQQIYRPGSGPLRKSTQGIGESESDTKLIVNSNESKSKTSGMERMDKSKSADSTPRDTQPLEPPPLEKFGDISISETRKKVKKPEQSFYVPRPVAQARESSIIEEPQQEPPKRGLFQREETNGVESFNFERPYSQNKSKRYSNKRRNEITDNQEWRTSNPSGVARNLRQGSEPRAIANQNSGFSNRCRETRSVEPVILANQRNYNDNKMSSKPPSGRRHSTIGLEPDKRLKNLDNLPPRLKKKLLEDTNLAASYGRNEENWDGSSITFQGTQTYVSKPPYTNLSNFPNTPQSNVHHHVQSQNQHHTNQMYFTLPANRSRGRGRLQQDYDNQGRMFRSATPEKMFASPSNSRPPTPNTYGGKVRSNENLNRYDCNYQQQRNDNRSVDERKGFGDGRGAERNGNYGGGRIEIGREKQGDRVDSENGALQNVPERPNQSETPKKNFNESLEAQLSPVSPPTPIEKETNVVPVSNKIYDWSEEVELNDQLEAEALSDALTRSSSVTSLMETSTKSLPNVIPNQNQRSRRKKNKRKNRRRSNSRNKDRDRSTESHPSRHQGRNQNWDDRSSRLYDHHRTRQSSVTSTDSKDNFRVPEPRRRSSRDVRDRSYDKKTQSRDVSRDSSFDRARRSSCKEQENWRDEIRKRQHSELELSKELENKDSRKGGLIILPPKMQEQTKIPERPKCPDINRKVPGCGQKTLFDPHNPNKPIVVKSPNSRVSVPGFSDNTETPPPQLYTTDQFGNVRPGWYEENSDKWKLCRYPDLLREIITADNELQYNISSGLLLINWGTVSSYRNFLMQSLEYLLCKDIKFCQSEYVEYHFWKILFYNIIEMMRKEIANNSTNREQYKEFVLSIIDEGTKYFELLLDRLEEVYNFKINSFLSYNTTPQKGKYVGLALIAAQKIFLYLGDLLRYREQVNETANYGKSRQWYIKAHEINPKNGKPYNQLALLAVYARRKLDAVYYYMRSLMSSNPVPSAKENLQSLFDENRKKYLHQICYEQGERKRREERLERARKHMKEKESESSNHPNSLRREIWIRPDSGRRVHRTTSAVQETQQMDSDEEDLAALSSVEVNKRFVTSYLHVHGKLITKIGMETFQETAIQMLKEFRALLQHSPVPLPCKRFLQLLALNMFAIESTQLKDPQLQSQTGYRSELQERALVVSLQMFNLILERCVSILQDHLKSKKPQTAFPQDLQIFLPAVKIWSDWMLCHSGVWNPPPSTQDYKVGPPGDAWSRIAALMNLLEKLGEQKKQDSPTNDSFVNEQKEGYEQVRLPEDAVLCGFTPLMHNVQDLTYAPKDLDVEQAQFALRLSKLLFFGTVFLCGLEPPVLKFELESDYSGYVSVVRMSSSRSSPPSPPELDNDDDLLVESFSEDEDGTVEPTEGKLEGTSSEIRDLLNRKVALEKRHRHQEIHRQRVQKILQQSIVTVNIEVRPKYLIPDTNCFIDYLEMIKSVATAHVYTLMVPLVVLNELEGLAKGGKHPVPTTRNASDPEHVIMVAESAKHALDYLSVKNSNIKYITTKGTILASSTFTVEDDSVSDMALKNDDKILSSCLALCKVNKDQHNEGEPRKLYREVVLLTEDRNLRVKALAKDVPVRELPDFIVWAGLG
nr:telomerase-binding protein EST1A isoform X1 [Onthophagus taurus]